MNAIMDLDIGNIVPTNKAHLCKKGRVIEKRVNERKIKSLVIDIITGLQRIDLSY